jgi:pyrroloquinoline quinone biosynthesis protein B
MELVVLGSGQDGGVPHTGCYCRACTRARRSKQHRRLGPSIAVIDSRAGSCYLIDASPDFKFQLDMVHARAGGRIGARPGNTSRGISTCASKTSLTGIFLTHAHFGHCAGLWHLGKETLNERALPVYGTPAMGGFLKTSHPFNRLVGSGNIEVRTVRPGSVVGLGGLTFVPVAVPHRNEVTDTVGYIIQRKVSEQPERPSQQRAAIRASVGKRPERPQPAKSPGPSRRVIYVPDVDRWTPKLIEKVATSDIALIDGTFYSREEVPNFKEVPHPPIKETIDLLKGLKTEIYFTHINHTNPVNAAGRERRYLEGEGLHLAYDGLSLRI